jgi:protocatechuate 3,4-dioxygenase alpha subunit
LSFGATPSQTVGPFFAIGLPWDAGPLVVPREDPGAIIISGVVYDGAGEPVPDALVETWQADPPLERFRGFGRAATDDRGAFELVTLKPGPVPWPEGGAQAPHIDASVFARGLLHRCVTRIYFADEPEANAADPVLGSVPADRRATLLAQPTAEGYTFDIRLQADASENETVFFAI